MDSETLPDRLADDRPEWTTRFERGDVLARAGASAEALYVIQRGRVGLWAAADGPDRPTRSVGGGEAIGLAAVLTGGTYEWTAAALETTQALRIPHDAVAELTAAAPTLMVQLSAGLARELQALAPPRPSALPDDGTADAAPPGAVDAASAAPSLPITKEAEPEAESAAAVMAPSLAIVEEAEPEAESAAVSETLKPLYREAVVCPICEAEFQATRVRTRALSAIRRDSDLHTVYEGLSPLHYAVDVCPTCAYASYPNDWAEPDEARRGALESDRTERVQAAGSFRFSGERTPQAGMMATLLALRCYDLRAIEGRRRAGILHRLAWIARELGDEEQELRYLAAAREGYERAYREDTSLSESAALRVSYLLGELAFRLGDPAKAIRWFERTLRSEGIEGHAELQRLAHDRWIDARESLRRSG